jgi:hypothetical protein
MTNYIVTDTATGKDLTDAEILAVINDNDIDGWIDYDQADLDDEPIQVLEWLDENRYEIGYSGLLRTWISAVKEALKVLDKDANPEAYRLLTEAIKDE